MKKSLVILAVLALGLLFTQSVFAQVTNSGDQDLTMTVSSIALLSVPAGPIALNITTGTPGQDALTPVTQTSTYSWVHNYSGGRKMTAQLTTALPTGYSLTVTTTPGATKGTGVTNKSLTNGSVQDVVTAMPAGFDAAAGISYTFGANASAAALAAGESANTVTYTIVAP